jgi:hypothetical protein
MSWRRFFRRSAAAPKVAVSGPDVQEPLAPEQLAELQDAWAELAEAAKSTGATGLHACSRNGRRWEEDPAAVRGLAAILRNVRAENVNG